MLKAILSFIMLREHVQGFRERQTSKAFFKAMLVLYPIQALRKLCASLIDFFSRIKSEMGAETRAVPQQSISQYPFDRLKNKVDILKTANRTARNHTQFLTYKTLALACGLSEREIAQHFNRDEQDVIAWCQGWASVPFEAKQELINLLDRKRAEIAASCILEPTDLLILTIPDVYPEKERAVPLGLHQSTAGEIVALRKEHEVRVIYKSELRNILRATFSFRTLKIHELYAD